MPRPPKPQRAYLPESQRRALAVIEQGLAQPASVVVLTGEAGLGKTTLLRKAIAAEAGGLGRVVQANGGTDDVVQAWRTLCQAASTPEATPLASGISAVDPGRAAQAGVLVVEDAHETRRDALRQLGACMGADRLGRRRPSLVLVGRPELARALGSPALNELSQHVREHAVLRPMDDAEAERYVEHLFQRAGTSARALMTEGTLRGLIEGAGGNPRQLNAELARALAEHRGREAPPVPQHGAAARRPRRRVLVLAMAAAVVAVAGLTGGVVSTLGPVLLTPASAPPEVEPSRVGPPPTDAREGAPAARPAAEPPSDPAPREHAGVAPSAPGPASSDQLAGGQPPSGQLPDAAVAELLARGNAMLELQDASAARRLFKRAASAGSAHAAMALAGTYDPARRAGKQWDPEASKSLAAAWYRRAAALGDPEASSRLKQLGAEEAAK